LSVVLTIFFLTQHIALQQLAAEPYSPLPKVKVSLTETNLSFRYLNDTILLALTLYKLDAVERYTKESIIKEYGARFAGLSKVRFDLENMDIGRKGWTRYYPFYIKGEQFIMRIFLTEESSFQPKVQVLYEGAIDNPRVTFQVLPPLQEILKACHMKPHSPQSASAVGTSL